MGSDHRKDHHKNTSSLDIKDYPEGLFRAKIPHSSETEVCLPPQGESFEKDEMIIVKTRYGNDMVKVLGPLTDLSHVRKGDIRTLVRRAGEGDLKKAESFREKEEEAFRTCREKIDKHKLDMALVSAHYLLDEPKVMFFFTAENRIDFRELVKDLVSIFKMRIELRQIGVRDESRVLGGLGVCGREYCCHSLTDHLSPVSIKMAKEQNLSLNSMKISGPCGRLLCCLSYEYQYYQEEKRKLPNEGSRIQWDGTTFKVIEVNIFSKRIRLSGGDGRMLDLSTAEISYNKESRSWELNPLEI
ncbi:MAG: regulatory iron-sulfur-containing complex subunit RicT [Spirochaetales bacterium]|nr:regulatory iron-sulfur-containing complex subunit RicT [Spirochaetales bacterium]